MRIKGMSLCVRVLLMTTVVSAVVLLLSNRVDAADKIKINKTNFPDDTFRSYVSFNFDSDGNGYLNSGEIRAVKKIEVFQRQIESLKGIEYFTALEDLRCSFNPLTTLDVSNNTALKILFCDDVQLTRLDVSNNTELKELYCSFNQLTSLDVSKNTKLECLYFENNNLTSVDVSKNTALVYLVCSNNPLKSLDVSKNTSLELLSCEGTKLTTLDLSKNTKLENLNCSYNQFKPDVSKNTALETLYCKGNQINSLDVSKNTNLKKLDCSFNQLKTLDVSKNTALDELFCNNNQLTKLDLSKNTALEWLYCDNNQLTTLDLSKNPNLYLLDCRYNFLSSKPQFVLPDSEVRYAYDPQYVNSSEQLKDYIGPVGDTATFTVKHSDSNAHYNWYVYVDGSWSLCSFPGAKTNTLSVPITEERDGYQFRCMISAENGMDTTSPTVTLYVERELSIISQPKDYSGEVGSTAKFKVNAEGTGIKYQWQTYTDGAWKNSSLTGAKTDALSVPVTQARDGYKFRCVVTDITGKNIKSKSATLHVAIPVSITSQPKDYTGAVGSTAKFKVIAEGTGLKYQWQTYVSGAWKDSSLTGAKTATLSVPVTKARDGYKFRCVVTDAYGKKATSKAVTLHVAEPVILAITTQPKSYTGPVGSTATFKVKAQGTGLKYQWQTYKNGKWTNSSLNGYATTTLSVPVTKARDGYKFRCVVTDASGNRVATKSVTLKVG